MIRSLRLAVIAVGALITSSVAAQAQGDPYRWCAEYGGRSGGTNCYFMTFGQCQAAVSGTGGYCRPNPFYTGNRSRRDYRVR
jgi:hypothetical protein